jgi:hypothetical protein
MNANLGNNLNEFKTLIKKSIWTLLSRHRQGREKNICIFASRRGGSTWLMELIASNKGVRYVDQPFSIYSASLIQFQYLPVLGYGQFIHLDKEEKEMVKYFFNRLFEGSLKINSQWKFWQKDFDFVSNRLVMKIVDAKGIIDWIEECFDVHIIYLTRHPIPQALSVMRNGWGLTVKAYLRNSYFTEHYLNDDILAYCHDILKEGSLLQKYVLNWSLENLVPIRMIPNKPNWIYISYEDLTLFPEKTILQLAKVLDLANIDAMMKKIKRPSRSTKRFSTGQKKYMISSHNYDYLIKGWKKEISDEDERSAFKILEKLGITIYQYSQFLPSAQTGQI